MAKKKISIIDDSDSIDEPIGNVKKTEPTPQKIKITHWEDEIADDPEPAGEEPADLTDEVLSDEAERQSGDVEPGTKIDITELSDDDTDSGDTELEVEAEDDEQWHKLDDEASKDEEAVDDEQVIEVSSVEDQPEDDEVSSTTIEVDDETEDDELVESETGDSEDGAASGHQIDEAQKLAVEDIDSEDEVVRPDWDEEKYSQQNSDMEDSEDHPEWDDEKWKTSEKQLSEAGDSVEDDAETKEAASIAALNVLADSADTSAEGDSGASRSSAGAQKSKLAVMQSAVRKWWNTPKLRNASFGAAAVLLMSVSFIPAPRYAVLNTVGVRASASIAVLDSETQLPLKNVSVTLSDTTIDTSNEGVATFDQVKLGSQVVTVEKTAYDSYSTTVTVKTGSNELDDVSLIPIGSSFTVSITDWLSETSIDGAEVIYKDNSAFTNSEGVAQLTVPSNTDSSIVATASAPGYGSVEVGIDATQPDTVFEAELVLDKKHYFISKRSGTYDVYSSRLDGTEQTLVVAGTGNEKPELRFDISPSGEKLVLASVRDKNIKNAEGFVLTGFYVIDPETKQIQKVDSSERIDIVGWIGESVIYVKIQAGASGRNPERHRLMSYDTQTGQSKELAASNYFNDVLVAKNYVFYAPSDAYKQNPKPYLYRIAADGSNLTTVFERTVWTIIQSDYNTVSFDSEQTWYETDIVDLSSVELDGKPSNVTSELYTDSPNGSVSARVDIRDGKGTLQLYNIDTNDEDQFASESGLRNPIVWMSDTHLVYRVVTANETADYILSTETGESRLISDVTNISGADRWYYYY